MPEGVTDVIPVDLVVAAIIAVAGEALLAPVDAEPAAPDVYHVASGVRNPFRYGRLVELVQSWFTEHPLYDSHGQPIVVPAWSFPGRGRVQRQLSRATKAMEVAERVVGSLPIRGRQANWLAALEERHLLADRALGYVELYGAYTETEARYRVDRLMALWDRMDEDDRRAFCLDPAAVDWATYVRDIHLPSVIEHARVRTAPTKSSQPSRADRSRKAILSPDRHLAAFDLENTLIASNVVDSYAWLASRHLSATDRVAFVADLVSEAPSLLALDRRDRGDFLRSFYRRYEGAPVDRLRDDAMGPLPSIAVGQVVPCRVRPGPPAPRPRPSHPPDHRRPGPGGRAHAALVRRHRVCPAGRGRWPVHRAPGRAPAHRGGPGPGAGRLRRGRGTASRGVDGLCRLGQ